jgi:hypothetical protein
MASPNQAWGFQNLANSESLVLNSKCGYLPKMTTLGFIAPICEEHLKHKILILM